MTRCSRRKSHSLAASFACSDVSARNARALREERRRHLGPLGQIAMRAFVGCVSQQVAAQRSAEAKARHELNDEVGVGDYTLLNLGVGYRFTNPGVLGELVLQADATNVTDEEYFSTIDSNGFVNADPNGTTQTLLRGAPRQFFVSAEARF